MICILFLNHWIGLHLTKAHPAKTQTFIDVAVYSEQHLTGECACKLTISDLKQLTSGHGAQTKDFPRPEFKLQAWETLK